jgi:alpha-glucosidase
MSNHDLPRAASRYSKGESDAQARLAMTLLLTLRGTPFMYYGEEIGMRDISLSRKEILDPPGKLYWPIYRGRDGCRSPMQWNGEAQAGFSSGKPWLPVHRNYPDRNVTVQNADPDSMLNFTKRLLALRKQLPALRRGDFTPLSTPPGLLAFLREADGQSVLVVMNFSALGQKWDLPEGKWQGVFSSAGQPEKDSANLGPGEVRILLRS